jgi:hypothetical protein
LSFKDVIAGLDGAFAQVPILDQAELTQQLLVVLAIEVD